MFRRPKRASPVRAHGHQRNAGGVRVGTWLVLIALLPLSGALWFAYGGYSKAQQAGRQAEAVAADVEQLVQLAELQAHLFDEQNMAAGVAGIENLSIDNEVVQLLVGFDLEALQKSTGARVDELMNALDLDAEMADLVIVRSGLFGSFGSATTGYPRISASLAARQRDVYDNLLRTAGDTSGGDQLVTSLRLLDDAATARSSFASKVTNYFIPQLSPGSKRSSLIALIAENERYHVAIDEISRLALEGSSVAESLAVIQGSKQHISFEREMVALIETLSRPEATKTVLSSIAELSNSGQVLNDAAASADLHRDLLNVTGSNVLVSSTALTEAAVYDGRRSLMVIGLLAIVSLTVAVMASRAIDQPLKALAALAQRLRDGDTITDVAVSGPAEIQGTIRALNEAAAHLHLAERQAQALAAGELNHPSLAEVAVGHLGASLQSAVGTLAVSLAEREALRDQLAHEASHDGLTQLPNRTHAMSVMIAAHARSKRSGEPLAVMFVDLDNFKTVNDEFGHAAGDAVLREVSSRLESTIRTGDHVGRFGGDEFLVIAEMVGSPEDAMDLAKRLVERLDIPFIYNRDHLRFSASVGVGFLAASSDLTPDELLRDADLAVYQAKARGRARVEFCDEALRAALLNRTNVENALRTAVDGNELVLHYQQIVSPLTHQPVALEALVRWEHPTRGLIAPGDFIPIAERSELIIEVDNWVLGEAARQLAVWTSDPVLGSLPITVNVSGRHLGSDGFIGDVTDPLRLAGVATRRLIVEVTESSVVEDLEESAAKLDQLRRLGIEVAIDDFGTGYASLSHLRALPIDVLKIDQSFTRDPSARSLAQLIVDTGHLLGARIVAEGIETAEQAEYFAAIGSDEMQGFLWGQPVPPDEMKSRLRAQAAELASPEV